MEHRGFVTGKRAGRTHGAAGGGRRAARRSWGGADTSGSTDQVRRVHVVVAELPVASFDAHELRVQVLILVPVGPHARIDRRVVRRVLAGKRRDQRRTGHDGKQHRGLAVAALGQLQTGIPHKPHKNGVGTLCSDLSLSDPGCFIGSCKAHPGSIRMASFSKERVLSTIFITV